MTQRTKLTLALLDNAYDSLNESLACVVDADVRPTRWKHAILHLVHAVELILKQRLVTEHPLFLYENVGKPNGHTVSLDLALRRLDNLSAGLKESENEAVRTAIRWRNNIMHYEVDLVIDEVRSNYLLVFEFLDTFHEKHLARPLTHRIDAVHLATAAALVQSFKKEFVNFQGRQMHRSWVQKLLVGQAIPAVTLDGVLFPRKAWGAESHWTTYLSDYTPKETCPDCATRIREFHGPQCDKEECPRCGGQLLSCDCDFDDSELWQS